MKHNKSKNPSRKTRRSPVLLKAPTGIQCLDEFTITLAACSQGGPVGYRNPSQGGTDGAAPTCISVNLSGSPASCNTGDQQVTPGPGWLALEAEVAARTEGDVS